jgi:hypothetical protein
MGDDIAVWNARLLFNHSMRHALGGLSQSCCKGSLYRGLFLRVLGFKRVASAPEIMGIINITIVLKGFRVHYWSM